MGKEVKEMFAKSDAALALLSTELRESIKALSAESAKNAQQIKIQNEETARHIESTSKQIKAVNENLGGIGNSQGDVAEEYFFNSLSENPRLGKIKFDRIESNRRGSEAATQRKYEFDLMLINGKSVAIIETKYKATKTALQQLERAVSMARQVLPEFKNHSIYGGIASFAIAPKLTQEAHKKGFFVLQRSGESFIADTKFMKAF